MFSSVEVKKALPRARCDLVTLVLLPADSGLLPLKRKMLLTSEVILSNRNAVLIEGMRFKMKGGVNMLPT